MRPHEMIKKAGGDLAYLRKWGNNYTWPYWGRNGCPSQIYPWWEIQGDRIKKVEAPGAGFVRVDSITEQEVEEVMRRIFLALLKERQK